ncbi:MAG: CotH kinase family protein [Bryobacteraceae bacterium]
MIGFAALAGIALAQPPDFGGGPPPWGGGRGPGGPGQQRKIVKDYDRDGDKRLNAEERKAAREVLAKEPRRGRFGPWGGNAEPPKPNARLTPAQVKKYGNEPLYDTGVLRTIFLEFENPEWEAELADFHDTDVDVPAKVTVDGKAYPGVGVHFRGMSSFMMVPAGRKRSLNLSFDFTDKEQRLGGYRTLNLLNSNGDPTFVRTALYSQIASKYIPIAKANFMRVVINGENWGVYSNLEQFNSDFTRDRFGSAKGARWKVSGRPFGSQGGLSYLGDDPEPYKRQYEIKTKDDVKSWTALIKLCKTLNETPAGKLQAALEPMLDIDGALRFLALDKALINSDGYWTRNSDYNIYLDDKGRFHVIPHDFNEALAPPEGPPGGRGGFGRGGRPGFPGGFGPPPGGFPPDGFRGGPPPGGERPPMPPEDAKLDPFAGSDDPNKPLIGKLLAVPELRQRYLGYVRDIARDWLVWSKLEPMVRQWQSLIAADVKADNRKLGSTEEFTKAITEETVGRGPGPFGGRPHMSLKDFVERRRAYLLGYPEIAKLK